jgi:hypothetical protein
MPVFNKHTDRDYIGPDAITIMRPHRWKNPFIIGVHGDRDTVIRLFREDLWRRIRAGEVSLEELAALHGQQLVCCCVPKPCHGHVLEAAAAWAVRQLFGKIEQLPQQASGR